MKVELLNTMGDDLTVVNAARVSFAKESEWENGKYEEFVFEGVSGTKEVERKLSERDTKLINYLANHDHWTPFGHCTASFRIKAPIFVARQLAKHQVGLVWNEVSRRYVDDEPEFYRPNKWRGKPVNAKQGSSNETIDRILVKYPGLEQLNTPNSEYELVLDRVLNLYNGMIESGIAPEMARMVLPQSMYTEWWWTGSLAAFARICKLRLDPHAQAETAEIAQGINDALEEKFPVGWKALMK